ncbi:MAG: leucine-rich repeat domain-containing protein [Treponema sp.]|jgi:hypothetical protein|nr:leucine-rich repeat domain-containing protein [Treponema sp.]
MENLSRKWEWSHLSRGVAAACFALLLFGIAGCDTGGGGGGNSQPQIHEPSDVTAFKKVLQEATTGISADSELVYFKLNWQLTPANWNGIIEALGTEGRYVSLDLSGCTKGTHTDGTGLRWDGTFASNALPDAGWGDASDASPGKTMIVELVLPDQATAIAPGEGNGGAFLNFLSLTKISGKNISGIGNYAFYWLGTPNLTEANFPKVTTLGNYAFSYCYSMTTMSFPEAVTIGNSAFANSTTLTSISLPKAQTIGNTAFSGCGKLTTIDLPEATGIGQRAFQLCEKLTTINLPKVTTISGGTYNPNTGVPAGGVFTGCTSLVTLNIPQITDLGGQAFTLCENSKALVITMGATAPKVGENLFLNVDSPRTVTVKRPATTPTGYTEEWQTNFKGKGWDGTRVITVDNNVTTPDNNTQITLSVIDL